jgi:hypothetical protein
MLARDGNLERVAAGLQLDIEIEHCGLDGVAHFVAMGGDDPLRPVDDELRRIDP